MKTCTCGAAADGYTEADRSDTAEALVEQRLADLKARAQIAVAILRKTADTAEIQRWTNADDECWPEVRSEVKALGLACHRALDDLLYAYQELALAIPDDE